MDRFDRERPRVYVEDYRQVNSFAQKVYGWMTGGLALTALVAWGIASSGAYLKLLPFWWVWLVVAFGISLVMSSAVQKVSFQTLAILFLAYAGAEGLFFGTILPYYAQAYGGSVIWTAFATAGGLYGFAVLYGIQTKSDMTRISKILVMGLIGLLAVSLLYWILSFFMNVTWMNLLISYLGLVIFIGLTAYDAQQIRLLSKKADGSVAAYKLSLMLAMRMYINVIMIFWYLLQIFSNSNRK